MSDILNKQRRTLLYSIVIAEIIIFAILDFNRLSGLLIVFLLFAWLTRMILDRKSQPNLWAEIRNNLTTVLIQNKIIPSSPSLERVITKEPYYFDESKELAIKINPNIIEDLRSVGIDGVLICLYLLKHRDSFCSVKVIQNDLQIPKSTIYRNIQKLVEMEYIDIQATLDEPGKSYYKISYFGENLMFDFYDLLHIPGTYAPQPS